MKSIPGDVKQEMVIDVHVHVCILELCHVTSCHVGSVATSEGLPDYRGMGRGYA